MNKIHPSSIVQNTNMGENIFIGLNCSIGGVAFNPYNEWQHARGGEVFLGDNVTIMHNTVIERGMTRDTKIGNNVRIGSGCVISHDVHIEDNVVVEDGTVVKHGTTLKEKK